VEFLQIDVASDTSISAAAKAVESKYLWQVRTTQIYSRHVSQSISSFNSLHVVVLNLFRLDGLVHSAASATPSSLAEQFAQLLPNQRYRPFLDG